jgi:effector-binding domain-containing protein
MLRLRRAQLEQEIASAQSKLADVDVRLKWIDEESHMPQIEVLRKSVPAITIAGARKIAAGADSMRQHCIALDRDVCRYMRAAGLKSDGVSLALYYAGEGEEIDVEMAYTIAPVTTIPSPAGAASVHSLDPVEVAFAVYYGSYDDFAAVGQLHAAIQRWIDQQGLAVDYPVREYYSKPPQTPYDPVGVMEIQYPMR